MYTLLPYAVTRVPYAATQQGRAASVHAWLTDTNFTLAQRRAAARRTWAKLYT